MWPNKDPGENPGYIEIKGRCRDVHGDERCLLFVPGPPLSDRERKVPWWWKDADLEFADHEVMELPPQ